MPPVKMTRAEYQAKYGVAPAIPGASTVTPTTTTTPVKMTRAEYQTKYGTTPALAPTPTQPTEKKPWLGEMAKSLISAPATMLARPLQLGYELLKPGDNTAELDKFSKEHLGGIVAPIPQNTADLKKDVGRGIETVALGLSPVAGGAAFGLGGSLEQGNDLFSAQTLLQSVVGAGAGKVIGLIGKPLLDVTGKVIGTITPKILKDVAMKGADAVAKFAAQHEILPAVGKAAVNKLETGAQAIDTGVGKLFTGGKGKIGAAITNQYPGLSKDSITKHFEKVERDALIKPTTESGATFRDATKIYTDAKNKGIDLGQISTNNKIYNKDIVSDGKYNTVDVVNSLRTEGADKSNKMLRAALTEAAPGVQRVPVSDVKELMINKVRSIKPSKITDAERQQLLNKIESEYGVGSAAEQAHPDGYSIVDLHDNKIATSGNVKKGSWVSPLNVEDTLSNTYYKNQSDIFKNLVETKAPKEIGVKEFNKRIQDVFTLADYLEKLNGKKAPTSLFQGAIRTGAKVSGAALGGSTGNVFGAFGGYHAGGMAVDSFMNASNPIKGAVLREAQISEPEIFKIFKDYIGDQETARLMRLQLPAGSKTVAPDLMKIQNASGAVEMGYTPKPITPGQTMANDMIQNNRFLNSTKQLPAPTPRTIVPNTQGTPNQPGVYPGTPEVGGMRQRIFKK